MIGEWAVQAKKIETELSATWTLDTRDLSRPSADIILRQLIAKSPAHMSARLTDEFFNEGPLISLFSDKEITEIIVNGSREIWFERQGSWTQHTDHFLTDSTYKNLIDRVCVEAGMQFDLSRPFADGRYREFRVHLTMAPLSHCAFHAAFRRLPKNPWTLESLKIAGWASEKELEIIRELLCHRRNILFIGPTGSGKTSILGACLKELPPDERTVILEDTDELPRSNAASTKLLTRPEVPGSLGEINLSDLVKQSLRMRPKRLVVGEVRGPEAKDLLMALATGHSGSLGTLHAADPKQALLRLEMLVQMGAPQWAVQAIRQLIQLSVDSIIVCANDNGHRRLGGVYKMAALESFGFIVDQLC